MITQLKTVFASILIFGAISAKGQTHEFFEALNQVEASGREGWIFGDAGRSLGPFQITKPCWIDACEQNPHLRKRGYDSVTRKAYAKQVVRAYFERYEPRSLALKDWETLARLWNGGPKWRKKKHLTDAYWKRFKKEFDRIQSRADN